MSKLQDYFKTKGMKSFKHNPVDDLPQLIRENIDGKRYYISPTGEKYPSITTVLSKNNNEGIIAWRKKVGEAKANAIASAAATRGTAVIGPIPHPSDWKVDKIPLRVPLISSCSAKT